jgi:hypothetical protein
MVVKQMHSQLCHIAGTSVFKRHRQDSTESKFDGEFHSAAITELFEFVHSTLKFRPDKKESVVINPRIRAPIHLQSQLAVPSDSSV